jgi:hypothetical protein
MIDIDSVDSDDLRNCLMDVVKCVNDEYESDVEAASAHGPLSKEGLRASEDLLRLSLYSVLLAAFEGERQWKMKDHFIERVGPAASHLASLIGALEMNADVKKTVAACLATCAAAAAENAR